MIGVESHTVGVLREPMRLSDYCMGIFESIPSRKGVKKAILAGRVEVNGSKESTGYWIRQGDVITLLESASQQQNYRIRLGVVFEDDHIAVINKPAGLLTSGNQFQTVERALPHNLKMSSAKDAFSIPKPAHRLDFPTSGLLIVAKTASALRFLKRSFENREIGKEYLAITVGIMPQSGSIRVPIDGKESQTDFEVIQSVESKKYSAFNLVRASPLTGRRHQIRNHLSHVGFPILGDAHYGGRLDMKRGLYLQSNIIQFQHPATNRSMRFALELPGKFQKILSQRTRRGF